MPTVDGKMMLMLSGNRKVVSLAVVQEGNERTNIELKAWNVKDLSQLEIPDKL